MVCEYSAGAAIMEFNGVVMVVISGSLPRSTENVIKIIASTGMHQPQA